MAYAVEVYDPTTGTTSDITASVLNYNSFVEIKKMLDTDITLARLDVRNLTGSYLYRELTVKDSGTAIITGVIAEQDDSNPTGTDKTSRLNVQDWGYYLGRRIVYEVYENRAIDYIIKDLVDKFASDLFTYVNVKTSATQVTLAEFKYITFKEAIDYLLNLTPDWHFYIDSDKDIHYFQGYEADMAAITGANILVQSLRVEHNGIEHYNRIWIIGPKRADDNAIDIYYDSDGTQRYFGPLSYEPSSLAIYLTPSGLPEFQLVTAEELDDDGSTYEMLYNNQLRNFYFPTYRDPASFVGTLRVNFKPVRQFIDYFENPSDVDTYGPLEKAVKNLDIVDRLEARRYGKSEVRRVSLNRKVIKFESDHADVLAAQVGERSAVAITGDITVSGNYLVKTIIKYIRYQRMTAYVEMEEML